MGDTIRSWGPMRWLLSVPWQRLLEQPAGVEIALAALVACVFLGGAAALGRLLALGDEPAARPRKKKGRRFGLKYLALVLVALLPGGLVGTTAVVLAMGKQNWRRDAAYIVDASLVLALALAWLSSPYFPLAELSDNLFVSGTLGLGFALFQFWATLKLLRESLGEPEAKVPWWPPLALWLQGALLFGSLLFILF